MIPFYMYSQGCRPADRESILFIRPYLPSYLHTSRVALSLSNLRRSCARSLSPSPPPSTPATTLLPPSQSPSLSPSFLLPSLSLPRPSHLPPAPSSGPPFSFPFPLSHSLVLFSFSILSLISYYLPALTIYSPSFALGGTERGVAYLSATFVIQLTAIYQVFNNCCGDG